ncbi:hypothetical protein N9Y37_11150 [Luminiphilus sp.]|nr:hypothetical protein [Luminiphilus sp.]
MIDRKKLLNMGVVVLLLSALAALAAHSFWRGASIYDEGFALTNALRIMRGDKAFLDFWSVYPPGTSYVLAMVFSIFEASVEVSRIVHIAWICLIITFSHRLINTVSSAAISHIASLIIAVWMFLALTPSYSMAPALALAIITIHLFISGYQAQKSLWIVTAALIGGLIIFFRHDISGYLFISFLICYGMLSLRVASNVSTTNRGPLLIFLSIYLTTTLLALATIIGQSGAESFINQALSFPILIQREQRFLPFPQFLSFWSESVDVGRWLLAWFTPVVLVVFAAFLLALRQNIPELSRIIITITWTMALLLLIQAFGRLDLVHVAPSMTFLVVMAFSTAGSVFPSSSSVTRASLATMLCAIIIYSLASTADRMRIAATSRCLSGAECSRMSLNQTAVVDYVNQKFPLNEPIFVGNWRHDRIHINDALLYFRLNRPIPTKWSEMHPGEVTTVSVQTEMVERLEEDNVSVVILVNLRSGYELNESAISSGAFVLDAYLQRNFSPSWRQGPYTVMIRTR